MTLHTDPLEPPKPGTTIYVKTSLYMSHGHDDFCGGLATVDRVVRRECVNPGNRIFVIVKERPGWQYNWKFLAEEQKKLAEQFGDQQAHADPDEREEFNRWD